MAGSAFLRFPLSGPVRPRAAMVCILAACLAGCSAVTSSPVLLQPTDTLAPSPSSTVSQPTASTSPAPAATATENPAEYSVRTSKADVWDEPENEGLPDNLQTQLIYGERVLVTETRGEWARIEAVEQPSHKDPLGYPGWVRMEDLAAGWPATGEFAIVMKPRAALADSYGDALMTIYLDARLPVVQTGADWVEVALPGGGTGRLGAAEVRITANPSEPIPTDGLFKLAESLVGQAYLWGGATTDGFDCSGLTYRLFHAYGITLPRDADDLALAGTPVDRADLRKGDFIFTSGFSGGAISHVGMYWGANTTLDASGPYNVAILPFTDFFYKMYWITARRILP